MKFQENLQIELKKIKYMMLANFRIRILYSVGILMELVNVAIGAGSYFFLTKVFQGTTGVMGKYGTDVVSYIILGIALNSMLMESLTGIYSSLVMSYFDRSLERIMLSPTSIFTLLFSNMTSRYLTGVTHAALYLVVGVLIFGINLGGGNIPLAILMLVLGLVATVGLGMLLSEVFFYTTVGKGGPNPILMFAYTFTNTFSGATFPVEILNEFAPWLSPISAFLPQTHALSAIRMILKSTASLDPSVIADVIYLTLFAVITISIGFFLIRKGMDRIRKEGYVPPGAGIMIF